MAAPAGTRRFNLTNGVLNVVSTMLLNVFRRDMSDLLLRREASYRYITKSIDLLILLILIGLSIGLIAMDRGLCVAHESLGDMGKIGG